MPFPDSLTCQICHGLAQQPTPLNCNHLYCLICIERHKLNNSMLCPVCLTSFKDQQLQSIPYLDIVINEYNLDVKTSRSSPVTFQKSQEEVSLTSSDSPVFTHFDIFGKEVIQCIVCKEYIRQGNFISHKQFCRSGKYSILGKAQMRKSEPIQKSSIHLMSYSESMSIGSVKNLLTQFGFLQKIIDQKTPSEIRDLATKVVNRFNQLVSDKQNQQDINGLKQMITEEIIRSTQTSNYREFEQILFVLIEKLDNKQYIIKLRQIITKTKQSNKKQDEIDLD